MRPAIFTLALGLFLLPVQLFSQKSESAIFPANATVQEIFSAGEEFLEGVVMSADGMLYFSDFPNSEGKPGKAGIIWTLDPSTKQYRVFRSPSGMSNGLKFAANGDLIVCEGANYGGRRITRTDMKSGKSVILAAFYKGRPFNAPNDLAIDGQGRIYFTDPKYMGPEPVEQNGMNVFRIDTDGSVHLAAANVAKPNGIVFSPDQKTLYVANCDYPGQGKGGFSFEDNAVIPGGEGSVYAFDVNPDGTLRLRSKLIDFGSSGGPDGMTVDADGDLYVALGNRVVVYSPAGKELAALKCPQATNLCFGKGPFQKTLFIVGGKSVYRIETKKEGFHLPVNAR